MKNLLKILTIIIRYVALFSPGIAYSCFLIGKYGTVVSCFAGIGLETLVLLAIFFFYVFRKAYQDNIRNSKQHDVVL